MSEDRSCPSGKAAYSQPKAHTIRERIYRGRGIVYKCDECGRYHIASGSVSPNSPRRPSNLRRIRQNRASHRRAYQ